MTAGAGFAMMKKSTRRKDRRERETGDIMRIDKYLKVSRIIKRRTVANDVCDGGKVVVNGREVKASYQVKIGDVIELVMLSGSRKFEVTSLEEKPGKNAEPMFREITG